jgi:lipid-A-disaccharide synthase
MANLIAGRRAVPELIQGDFTASNLVSHLMPLLHDEAARDNMKTSLRDVSAMLKAKAQPGETAIDRAANITAQMLHPKKSQTNESCI